MDIKPDMKCVPFGRKKIYFTLTVPYFLLLMGVSFYLGNIHPGLAAVFWGLFALMCFFQAYCCVYQECPYIGTACPAIAGIIPASLLARFLYKGSSPKKSARRFKIQAALATLCWLAIMLFPLYWLARLHWAYAAAYLLCHAAYYAAFGLFVCPGCAIRKTCPGGWLQGKVLENDR